MIQYFKRGLGYAVMAAGLSLSTLSTLGCASKIYHLHPSAQLQPDSAILWGRIDVTVDKNSASRPLAVFLGLTHRETGKRYEIQRDLKDKTTLVVLALPAGTYTVDKFHFYGVVLGYNTTYAVSFPEESFKYVTKRGHLAYFGRLAATVYLDSREGRVQLRNTVDFDHDYPLFERTYTANAYRRAPHIFAPTGETIGAVAHKGVPRVRQGQRRFAIPFVRRGGVITVMVDLNDGLKKEMIVDTGCSLTTLREDTAAQLGFVSQPGQELVEMILADGGRQKFPLMQLGSLELGGARVENLGAAVCAQCDQVDARELLCNDFLGHFNVEIDYKNSRMVLNLPTGQ